MKKLIFLPIITFFFILSAAYGEGDCTIQSIHFLPPTYYVGDVVTLRITLDPEAGCALTPPETYPSDRWVRVKSAELDRLDGVPVITVRFISFYPGERALPPIVFGSFVLRNITLKPASVMEETEREFAPLRTEILLPGTRLFFFALFSGAALIVLFMTLALPRVKSRLDIFLRERRVRQWKKKFFSELADLKRKGEGLDSALFYRRLSGGVKKYIGEKKRVDCLPLTSGEMKGVVEGTAELSEELAGDIVAILRRSELVRFGGAAVSREQKHEDLQTVAAVIEELEHPGRAKAVL